MEQDFIFQDTLFSMLNYNNNDFKYIFDLDSIKVEDVYIQQNTSYHVPWLQNKMTTQHFWTYQLQNKWLLNIDWNTIGFVISRSEWRSWTAGKLIEICISLSKRMITEVEKT